MAVTYHPMNFDSITKGMLITKEEVASIVGFEHGTDEYRFALVELRSRIMRECKQRDNPVSVCIHQDAIRILTDEEAVDYNAKQFRQSTKRQRRAYTRQAEVDQSNLSERKKAEHEHRLLVDGARLLAGDKAQAALIRSHERTVPVTRSIS